MGLTRGLGVVRLLPPGRLGIGEELAAAAIFGFAESRLQISEFALLAEIVAALDAPDLAARRALGVAMGTDDVLNLAGRALSEALAAE